jgi:hypothetical protein
VDKTDSKNPKKPPGDRVEAHGEAPHRYPAEHRSEHPVHSHIITMKMMTTITTTTKSTRTMQKNCGMTQTTISGITDMSA